MTWEFIEEYDLCPVVITGDQYRTDQYPSSPVLGLMINHESFARLIESRDPALFDVLEPAAKDAESAKRGHLAKCFIDAWKYRKSEYKTDVRSGRPLPVEITEYLDSHYLTDDDREAIALIRSELESVKVKASLMRVRRNQFQSKRPALMLSLIERDGYKCQETGAVNDLTIDHIIPLSKGGTDDLSNLRLVHKSVNSSKGDKMIEECSSNV